MSLAHVILEKIAEGGMGVVYKATDKRLKRTVALKFLRKRLFENTDEKVRFIAEARVAGSIDHPNICTIYDIDEIEGRLFIAMAYIERGLGEPGTTLSVDVRGKLLPVRVARMPFSPQRYYRG